MGLEYACGSTASITPFSVGTGVLTYGEVGGSVQTELGNVSLVDIEAEAEVFNVYSNSDAVSPSVAAITKAWRIKASCDAFTMANLAMLMNGDLVEHNNGGWIGLRWMFEPTLYKFTFTKEPDGTMFGIVPAVTVILWNAYIEPEFTMSLPQDEFAYLPFSIVALPDFNEGTEIAPFGVVLFDYGE